MTGRFLSPALSAFVSLALLSPAAGAAALWAGADVTTQGFGVRAGAGLPIPLVGAFGVEAGAEKDWRTDVPSFSVAATLRDLNLPLTNTDAFVSAGLRYRMLGSGVGDTKTYGEVGIRTPLLGPAGLRWTVRAYPGSGEFRAGLGAEIRF